jgi:hypothetical protein
MSRINSNSVLIIDGTVIGYKPNTLIPNPPKAEGKVVTATLGGGAVARDLSIDDSMNVATVEFELNNTNPNKLLVAKWAQKFNAGVGMVIEIGGEDVFKEMFYVGASDFNAGHEGTIKIKFEGGGNGI